MSKNQYNSASPNKNFQTRTIYKNAKEDETVVDNKSLYNVTYGKTGQSQFQATGKVTLADLGAYQRTNSRSSVTNLRNKVSEAANNNQQRSGSKQQDLRRSCDVKSSVGFSEQPAVTAKAAPPAQADKPAHQCNYESQLLKDAMKTAFGDNPHVNIDNEAEYYETVKRLDVCGKCWAAQQKFYTTPFKIKHKGPGLSLYQKDYVKHPLNSQGPALKNDFYTTFKNNEPMDFTTTMRNDFKPFNVEAPKKETMNFRPATTGIPFAGKSQYKSEYANWGANTTAYEKASQALTTIPELPFMANTTYRDNFATPEATQQLKPKDRDLWNKTKKSPITSAIPFLGESTNAAAYKPFKVSGIPNFETPEEYQPTEALPEHHKSLYARDFAPKSQWICPAVIFMEQTPHPKQKYLNA